MGYGVLTSRGQRITAGPTQLTIDASENLSSIVAGASSFTLGDTNAYLGIVRLRSAGLQDSRSFTLDLYNVTTGAVLQQFVASASPQGEYAPMIFSWSGVNGQTYAFRITVPGGAGSGKTGINVIESRTFISSLSTLAVVPVPVTQGGTGLTGGTNGGIPYYNGATSMASSAALTQYGVMYGGGVVAGVGQAPAATAAGTNNTVLHGNTGAAPTFSAVDLAADVTGVLPVANGGTGSATGPATIAISNDISTNATMYPVWTTATSGNLPLYASSTRLNFNPLSGAFTSWSNVTNAVNAAAQRTLTPAGATCAVRTLGTTVTITVTDNPHNLIPGVSVVTLAGFNMATDSINGTWVVATCPSATTFAIASPGANETSSAATSITVLQKVLIGTLPTGSNTTTYTVGVEGVGFSSGTMLRASPTQAVAATAGNAITIQASPAIAGTSTTGAAAGGDVNITAGAAARLTNGNAAGGNVILTGGTGIGTGARGTVQCPGAGANSECIGIGTASAGGNSVALGTYASSAGFDSVAIGRNSGAPNSYCTAVGGLSSTGANCAVAVGYNAIVTTNTGGIAIGGNSSATATNYTLASGLNAIAIGSNSAGTAGAGPTASGAQSIAIGYASDAVGTNSIAIGNGAQSAGGGPAIGASTTTTYSGDNAFGTGCSATGQPTLAAGYYASASGGYSVCLAVSDSGALRSVVSGTGAIGIGMNPLADTNYAFQIQATPIIRANMYYAAATAANFQQYGSSAEAVLVTDNVDITQAAITATAPTPIAWSVTAGNTCTITYTAHKFSINQQITFDSNWDSNPPFEGLTVTILTVPTANTFTFTTTGGAASGSDTTGKMTPGDILLTLSTNTRFYPARLSVWCSSGGTVTVQPYVRFGKTAGGAEYVAATQTGTIGLAASENKFFPIAGVGGSNTLTAGISTAGTVTVGTCLVRFCFMGKYVRNYASEAAGAASTSAGEAITMVAGAASTTGAGGSINFTAGAAAGAGVQNGGSIILTGGAASGTGTRGTVQCPGAGTTSTVIGSAASGASTDSTAVGTSATAGLSAAAFGPYANAGTSGVAIGYSATANAANYCIAIGRASVASGTNAVAIGTSDGTAGAAPLASGASAIAIGGSSGAGSYGPVASGAQSIAIGYASDATQTDAIAIGDGAQATGLGSTSIGYTCQTAGTYGAVTIGYLGFTSGNNSVSIGYGGYTTGVGSVSLGTGPAANVTGLINDTGYSLKIYATPIVSSAVTSATQEYGSSALAILVTDQIDITQAAITATAGVPIAWSVTAGNVCTITYTSHKYSINQQITFDANWDSNPPFEGLTVTVLTVPTANTFTFTTTGGAASGSDTTGKMTPGDILLTLSANTSAYPVECFCWVSTSTGPAVLSVQPTVRFGQTAGGAEYVAATLTSGLGSIRTRNRFMTMATDTGSNTLTAGISVPGALSSGTVCKIRMGFLMVYVRD